MTNIYEKYNWLVKNVGKHVIPKEEECIEFYYKAIHDHGMSLMDADDYSCINAAFGYDVGAEQALEIIRWFYEEKNSSISDEDMETVKLVGQYIIENKKNEKRGDSMMIELDDVIDKNLISIGMYADTTGLFTDEECNNDNWVDMLIPERIVKKWYEVNDLAKDTAKELNIPINECNWKIWANEVSWGGDTDGLYDFCIENGYTPDIDCDNKGNAVMYADDNNYKYIVFEGNTNECRRFCKENDWKWDDEYELTLLNK